MSDNHIMTQPEDEVYLALGSYQLPDLGFLIIDKTLVAGSHTEAAELARAWMRETHGEPEELVVYRLDQWTELCALLRALEPTPVPALEPVS